MLWWLTPWHIRILCSNAMDGGYGFLPEEVGRMSCDQLLLLLLDKDLVRKDPYGGSLMPIESAALMADKDGMLKGRSIDGKPIKGKLTGKSLASRVREQKEKERQEREKKEPPKLSKRELRQQQRREQEEAQKAKRK